jgi:hypothetical protein
MKRNLYIGSTLLALLVGLGFGQGLLVKRADAQAKGDKIMIPRFEVDPTFPKPLPNHWYQGMSIGVGVDANDHVWIVHRPDTVNPLEAAEGAGTGACWTARWRVIGAARTERVISGPDPTTASPSTTKAMSGLAATAPATAWC